MAKPFKEKIYLNSKVVSVDQESSSDKVCVHTENGKLTCSEYVISTVPLGVLHEHRVAFHPKLSHDKMSAMFKMKFVPLAKVCAQFDEKFWNREILLLSEESVGYFDWAISVDEPKYTPGSATLCFELTGELASRVESQHMEMTHDDVSHWLDRMFPNVEPRPQIRNLAVSRWSVNPNFGGAISVWPVGMTPDEHQELGRHEGRVFFAGEHTDPDFHGTITGGLLSGERAGHEVSRLMHHRDDDHDDYHAPADDDYFSGGASSRYDDFAADDGVHQPSDHHYEVFDDALNYDDAVVPQDDQLNDYDDYDVGDDHHPHYGDDHMAPNVDDQYADDADDDAVYDDDAGSGYDDVTDDAVYDDAEDDAVYDDAEDDAVYDDVADDDAVYDDAEDDAAVYDDVAEDDAGYDDAEDDAAVYDDAEDDAVYDDAEDDAVYDDVADDAEYDDVAEDDVADDVADDEYDDQYVDDAYDDEYADDAYDDDAIEGNSHHHDSDSDDVEESASFFSAVLLLALVGGGFSALLMLACNKKEEATEARAPLLGSVYPQEPPVFFGGNPYFVGVRDSISAKMQGVQDGMQGYNIRDSISAKMHGMQPMMQGFQDGVQNAGAKLQGAFSGSNNGGAEADPSAEGEGNDV